MPIDILILPAGGKGGDIYGKLEQMQQKPGEGRITCIREIG